VTVAGVNLDLGGYRILPGLINAHDHLEFNLFPRLGSGLYPNATEWAKDIYKPDEPPVSDHLRVPKRLRLIWGGLKNLLSGVTTVCHHNPYDSVFDEADFPVRVVKRFGWAHSLRFSPDIAERFRATPEGWPFVIHLGEATDAEGAEEIYRLDEMGALTERTVLVHAVALDRDGLDLVRRRGASIVWCPSSNLFTLGRTLDASALDGVALGTDSALTGAGDMLDELEVADADYRMVSCNPSCILRLEERPDDWIAVREFGEPPVVVAIGGVIRLIALELAVKCAGFHKLHLEGRDPVLVNVDIPSLYAATAGVLCDDIRLAGRRVLP
jgi:cytosine/adenosine deaminase-related metal-dependent hydrolase